MVTIDAVKTHHLEVVKMHCGKITNPRTKAGQVYSFLKANRGRFFGGWDLTLRCQTTAISTRVSEINMQLQGTNEAVETRQDGQKWFYGLVDKEPLRLPGM